MVEVRTQNDLTHLESTSLFQYSCDPGEVLVQIGAGIGNVVLATPLLAALHEMRFKVDVWLCGDYAQTVDLLRAWSAVRTVSTDASLDPRSRPYTHLIPAIPPSIGLVTHLGIPQPFQSCRALASRSSTRMNRSFISVSRAGLATRPTPDLLSVCLLHWRKCKRSV